MAATYDGSTIKLYVNGKLEATTPVTGTRTTNQGNIQFGALRKPSFEYWLDGEIDGIKIYKYARTAAEIMSDYASAGLVGYWSFNEGSGAVAHDSSGNGNDGVMHDSSWVDGAVGKALHFNGVDSWVEIPTSLTLTSLSQITLEAWIQQDSIPSRPNGIISKCDGVAPPTNAEYFLGTVDNGRVFFETDNNVAIFSQTSAQLITEVGKWYHVAGTWSGNSYTIYVNGQQVLTGSCLPQSTRGNTLPVQIGRHGDFPGYTLMAS